MRLLVIPAVNIPGITAEPVSLAGFVRSTIIEPPIGIRFGSVVPRLEITRIHRYLPSEVARLKVVSRSAIAPPATVKISNVVKVSTAGTIGI